VLRGVTRAPVKEALILLSLAGGGGSVAERLGSLGVSAALLFYLALFGGLLVCLILAAQVRPALMRWSYALLFAVSAFFLDSFERITDDPLTYDAFINMVNSSGFAGDALRQHGGPIAWSGLVALLLFAGIAIEPRAQWRLPRSVRVLAPLGGVAALSLILFVRGGDGARGLPGAFTPLAYSGILAYESGTGLAGPRQDVAFSPARPPGGDIVLIVDESVGGHYLDINSRSGVRSGLGEERPGVAIHNFGLAASITNCSVGTNVTLRHGGTRADYQRINATMPSIWRYARKAGLRTVYLDGQRTGGELHNLMTSEERRDIDLFVQFGAVPVRDRDLAAADKLAELLGNGTREFVLVNKVGAHFPVHDKYPDDHMRYRPALPRGRYAAISDTGSRAGFGGGQQDWVRYRNAYRNTLGWNVGAFFDRLFERAPLSGATLIYTSDHGQDLHERGDPGLSTHCSADPVVEEGIVPLVVIDGTEPRRPDWGRHVAAGRNRQSHYAIFPTLLALMGYRQEDVRPIYGPSLAEPSPDGLTFNARFNARLGKKPVWVRIDPQRIASPPESRAYAKAGESAGASNP
jgi:hypothetical protein